MRTIRNDSNGGLQAASSADSDGEPLPLSAPKCNPITQDLPAVLLTQLEADALACVSHITASSEDVDLLKAMGVCTGRKIEIIQAGDPMILRVLGTRLGISARLAHTIWVNQLQCECRSIESGEVS